MTNINTNYQKEQSIDDQELRQALEDEHYDEVAASVGETACGCVPEYIVDTQIERHQDPIADFVKKTFNPDSIGFLETGASTIIEPDNFLERVEAIQKLFFEHTPKPSVGDNASALKQVVTLTEKLDKMSRQVPENFSSATLDDPKKYKANLMRKMELEEKNRAQIYRDSFGYNQLINSHYLTIEDFRVILDADIRNLRGILRSDDKPSDLDANKINRYLESVDQYVVARTQSQ